MLILFISSILNTDYDIASVIERLIPGYAIFE